MKKGDNIKVELTKKTTNISRNQLKEIIRKVYLKNIIKEDVDEGLKTQISNILSNFFADERNLEIIGDGQYFEISMTNKNKLQQNLNSIGYMMKSHDFEDESNFYLMLKKTL